MARVTIYGTEVANPPAHLRWKMAYEITETSDTYSVSLVGILQTGSTSGNIYDTTNAYLNATGKNQTPWSENGKKDNLRFLYAADWGDTTIFSSRIISWNKTHSTQSVSISLTSKGVRISNASVSKSFTIPAKPSYVITYNANGGTGAPGGQTKWYGEDINLQAGKPTRTGYAFKNWNTKKDGTGTNYNPSQKYSTNAGLTLYAIWKPLNEITIYDENGQPHTGRVMLYDENGKLHECIISVYDANGNIKYPKG